MHKLRTIHYVIIILSHLICSSGSGEGIPILLVRAHQHSKKNYEYIEECGRANLLVNREIKYTK